MGPYALQICLCNEIRTSRTEFELTKKLRRYDSYIVKIVADYCHLATANLSLNRITSELGISAARIGPSLIRYTAGFHKYISELSENCPNALASEAAKEDGETWKVFGYANTFLKPMLSASVRPPAENHWLNSPKRVRKSIAPIILATVRTANSATITKLRSLVAAKKYMEARNLADDTQERLQDPVQDPARSTSAQRAR